MTARERTTFFDQLCVLRTAYEHLDPLDRAGITPMREAMADAERELADIENEVDSASVDPDAHAHRLV